jgi:probable HAF family extracellular repeat protein
LSQRKKEDAMTPAIRTAACTSIGIAMLAVATAAGPRYSIVDLGAQLGDFPSFASDINNRRQIVGAIERNATPYPFIWEDGVVTELPPLPSESSGVARAINDRGQIVGDIALKHAVLWEGGAVTELVSSFDLRFSCSADAINKRGQIVGSCNGSAFLWDDGVVTLLPTLPGGDFAMASGINRFGTTVGGSQTVDGEFHAVLWRKGEVFELARLPGSTFSTAIAINNHGQAVGFARDASGVIQAVLWQKGAIISLETLPGAPQTVARAINDRGQIVGQAGAQPVLWEHGSLIQLGGLREGDVGGALGINNRGEIVGSGGSPDDTGGALLWTRRRPH